MAKERRRRLAFIVLVGLLTAGCGSSSSSPSTTSTPTTSAPSTAPATTPSTTTTPTTVTQSVLAKSSLEDLSWTSPSDGWALATQSCSKGECVVLARSTNGGAGWQQLPDPPAQTQNGNTDCSKTNCVSQVGFASSSIGYLFGPALLMSTNGGHSWQRQQGLNVEALAPLNGTVFRVAFTTYGCPGPCKPILQESSPGSTIWRTLVDPLLYPDRSGNAQIIGSGKYLLVAMYGSAAGPVSAQAVVYRSNDGGATWHKIADPCSGKGPGGTTQEEDLIRIAAAPGGFFAGLCSPHTGSATFVVSSSDGGSQWNTAGTLPQHQDLSILAAASQSTIAVATGLTAGGGSFTAQLLVSSDGGLKWRTAATQSVQLSQIGVPAWLGFQSPSAGTWLSDPHGIWMTSNGGTLWTRIQFQ